MKIAHGRSVGGPEFLIDAFPATDRLRQRHAGVA
jgi:hypothetical protein